MKLLSLSTKIYIGLVIILAILAGIYVFLPQYLFLPSQNLPASKPVLALINAVCMLIIYGGLGFLGLKLTRELGFVDIWDKNISNKQRFLIPAAIGGIIGLFFIIIDLIFRRFNFVGAIPHPPFPSSIVASGIAGIGEEIIFRLFFISFWTWFVSRVILKRRWQNQIFWITAIFSAVAFALGHLPSLMILFGWHTFTGIPLVFLTEILILNGVLSIFAAYYFRKFGFLAAVGVHFWTDIVWHVIWGII